MLYHIAKSNISKRIKKSLLCEKSRCYPEKILSLQMKIGGSHYDSTRFKEEGIHIASHGTIRTNQNIIKLYEEIEKLTEYTQRSKSAYIRQVLRIYLRYYAEHAEEAESDPLIVK